MSTETLTPTPTPGAPPLAPPPAPAPAAAPTPGMATPEPVPDDIEIDLGGDAASPAAAPAAPPSTPAAPVAPPVQPGLKVKPDRAQNRVQTALQERDEAIRAAQEERAARERAQQIALELAERERKANIAAMTHYEARWTGEEARARAALSAAVDAGDSKLQADAMAALNEAQSNLVSIRNWKAANPQAMQPPVARQPTAPVAHPQQPAQRQPQGEIQLDPATTAWVAQNPWFNPEADEFQEDMHVAAVRYATDLEQRLVRAGRQAEVSTPAYFARIEAFIRQEFPDAFDGVAPPAAAPQPMRNGGAPVAPAQRGPAPGQAPPRSGNSIRLTGPERQMARNLADQGAIKNPDGTRMNHAQAEVYFAKQKQADQNRRKDN